MLSDKDAALLIRYYQSVELAGEQKDRLIVKYWEAGEAERRQIALTYAKLFAEDGAFVQRLVAYFDFRKHAAANGNHNHHNDGSSPTGASPTINNTSCFGIGSEPVSSPFSNHNGSFDGFGVSGGGGTGSPTTGAGAGGGGGGGYVQSRMTHSQRLLRTAIQDKYPKLAGPGPYRLSFGIVRTESERKEVIDLYASQFTAPDPPELQRLVTLPQNHSTRTRRRISGNYSWYLRCLDTREIVCAVTVTAHHHNTHHFVEMPLFATAGGYKKNGFGRLLSAALAAWCVRADFEFIMISADVNAIPFWRHMGYEMMTGSELKKIEFYYQHECYKFAGAEAMVGYCSPARWFRGATAAASQAPPPPLPSPAMASATASSDIGPASPTAFVTAGSPTTAAPAPVPLCGQRVSDVLRKMGKFEIVGPLELRDDI